MGIRFPLGKEDMDSWFWAIATDTIPVVAVLVFVVVAWLPWYRSSCISLLLASWDCLDHNSTAKPNKNLFCSIYLKIPSTYTTYCAYIINSKSHWDPLKHIKLYINFNTYRNSSAAHKCSTSSKNYFTSFVYRKENTVNNFCVFHLPTEATPQFFWKLNPSFTIVVLVEYVS